MIQEDATSVFEGQKDKFLLLKRLEVLPARIGVFVARERSAVTIVTPALGPS